MEAIEFVTRYRDYIKQLEKVVRPEYQPIIKELKKLDPHDFIKPELYFSSEAEAKGVVLGMFLLRTERFRNQKLSREEKQAELTKRIDAAKELFTANGIQSKGLWCIDDIIDKAREMKIRCSKKDARIILKHIEQDFDAEFGINWQTIAEYVGDYFQEKNKTNGR